MRQTLALLLDAYRDMNSRKMFWIALILSTIVAASFFAVGINDQGFSIFGHIFHTDFYNTRYIARAEFYKEVFVGYGVDFWLSLIAIALALITTASIYPDFLTGGTVDLFLAKPISRIRLFFTKYLCGMIYVAIQVFCFCFTCFLVIGLRGGEWLPGIFWAVPLVLLFYSYLYSICVFWGVWTRSTIASVLLTTLLWFLIWGVHQTEVTLLAFQDRDIVQTQELDQQIASEQTALAQAEAQPQVDPPATAPSTQSAVAFFRSFIPTIGNPPPKPRTRRDVIREQLADAQTKRATMTDSIKPWHGAFYAVMTVLPKNTETVQLLTRVLLERTGMEKYQSSQSSDDSENAPRGRTDEKVQAMLVKQIQSRSITWVVGTSVGFECFMLAISAWMFCRRDY